MRNAPGAHAKLVVRLAHNTLLRIRLVQNGCSVAGQGLILGTPVFGTGRGE